MVKREAPLRFALGDRVRCRTGARSWDAGLIVALEYRENDWPAEIHVPYQIELDNGQLIFAPQDDDHLIRAERDFERMVASAAVSSSLYGTGDDSAPHTVHATYREKVLQSYPQKHPDLFDPKNLPRFLAPAFAAALRSPSPDAAIRSLWVEEARGLYSFELFSNDFCTWLLDECSHFEAWCLANAIDVHRPNTMNNHGAILDDFGLAQMMDEIMRTCVQPLLRPAGFLDVLGGEQQLLSHHAFLVSYAMGKDLELGFHVDASDVTLNLCLGAEGFEGGELFFKGVRCNRHRQGPPRAEEEVTYAHTPGKAVLHRGKHRHGAHRLRGGERHNLIIWCRGDPEHSSEGCQGMDCQPWCWAREGLFSRTRSSGTR